MLSLQYMKYLFFLLFVTCVVSAEAVELADSDISFDYLSTDGAFWYDCFHEKGSQPHQWRLKCGDKKIEFNIHLLLREYKSVSRNEVTVEFHYWADRIEPTIKSAKQSTWITMDKNSNTKKIMGYVGFDDDANQLRIEINLN